MNNIQIGQFQPKQLPPKEKPAISEQDMKVKAYSQNLRTLSKVMDENGNIDPSRVRLVKEVRNGVEIQILKINNSPRRLFSKSTDHAVGIENFINSMFENISQIERDCFSSSLATSAARYNQHLSGASQSSSKNTKVIRLSRIINEDVPEIVPKEYVGLEKRKARVAARKDEPEIIKQKRMFTKKNVRVYRGDRIDHGVEAKSILKDTQWQNVKDTFYRLIRGLGIRHKCFAKHDYYHGLDKDTYGSMIYSKDKPMPLNERLNLNQDDLLPAPTSYWLGHATMLFNITVRSENDKNKATTLRVITDPVEGDLAPFLYPRKTEFGKPMEKLPPPHVYLLSHNHLDHYSDVTIDKLLSDQPVMVVPKGDGYRFTNKGFKNVQELDWWESTLIKFKEGNELYSMEINAVPSRHWAGQGPCGGHESTFLGYVIKHESGDLYFAGDTARLYKGPKVEISNQEKEFRRSLVENTPEALSLMVIDSASSVNKVRELIIEKEKSIKKQYKRNSIPADVRADLNILKTAEKDARRLAEITKHVSELMHLASELRNEAEAKGKAADSSLDEGEASLLFKQAKFLKKEAKAARSYALNGEEQELSHIDALKDLFNIKYNYQPGGPDERREDMESTHQASVDSMWTHDQIMLQRFYKPNMNKEEFLVKAGSVKTVLMHTMTYKLGNLKLFDTAESLSNVLHFLENKDFDTAKNEIEDELNKLAENKYPIRNNAKPSQITRIEEKRHLYKIKINDETLQRMVELKRYEWQVVSELIQSARAMQFADGENLSSAEMAALLRETVIVPRIGSHIDLGVPKNEQQDKCVF